MARQSPKPKLLDKGDAAPNLHLAKTQIGIDNRWTCVKINRGTNTSKLFGNFAQGREQ